MGVLAEALAIARGRPLPSTTTRAVLSAPRLTWTASGGLTLAPGEGSFERSAVALRCLLLVAQNLAALDLVTLVNGEPDERDEVAALWNSGSPAMPFSARVAREVLAARAEITGEAFAYLPRDAAGRGPVRGIFPIFGRVEPLDWRGETPMEAAPAGFRVHTGSSSTTLLPEEVLWLRYPHPLDPWGVLPPWKAALGAVETDALASRWQREEYRNSARPSSVIHLGDLSDERHEEAVETYESRIAGPQNASRSLIVSGAGKATVQHLGLSPAEMSFIESRLATADEVMLAFGVNPDLLRAGSTYENRAAAKTALWSDVLLPKTDTFSTEIDRQLQPDPGRVTGFDLSHVDALRESVDALYTRAVAAVQADLVTIDEGRAMLDLEPLPGGAGSLTITPYRAATAAAGGPPPTARGLLSGGPAPRVVRAGGRTLTIRARARVRVEGPPGPRQILAAYDRHERVGEKAIRALAARQRKAVEQALRTLLGKGRSLPRPAAGPLVEWDEWDVDVAPEGARARRAARIPPGARANADDVFDAVFWTGETAKALDGFLTGTWVEGADVAARRLSLNLDLFEPRVLTAMEARRDVLADRVTQTTRAILEAQILAPGVEEGESIPDLKDRLLGTFDDLAEWRGTMIARTETVGGFNAASHEVAMASGLVLSREWLATEDARTRPSHTRVNGERLHGPHAVYSNGLRHPGDPTGPPAETINCRCVELFDVDE